MFLYPLHGNLQWLVLLSERPLRGSDNCSSDGKGPRSLPAQDIAITHYSFIGKSRGLLIAASSDPAFQNVENQQRPQISLPQDKFGSAEVCLNTKLCSHASNACIAQCSQSLLGNCTLKDTEQLWLALLTALITRFSKNKFHSDFFFIITSKKHHHHDNQPTTTSYSSTSGKECRMKASDQTEIYVVSTNVEFPSQILM